MDEKELRNIFQKFYRTKKAEASGEAGTGIGLSIVEQIVQHHGGRMEVTSTPGKGIVFYDGDYLLHPSPGWYRERGRALNEGYNYCHVCWSSKMTALSGTP